MKKKECLDYVILHCNHCNVNIISIRDRQGYLKSPWVYFPNFLLRSCLIYSKNVVILSIVFKPPSIRHLPYNVMNNHHHDLIKTPLKQQNLNQDSPWRYMNDESAIEYIHKVELHFITGPIIIITIINIIILL